jgi:hypothetical protein
LDWGSFTIGAIIGAIATKVVDSLWNKGEQWLYKRKNPPLPYMGKLDGVKRKDD